jgi:hypothetical protein
MRLNGITTVNEESGFRFAIECGTAARKATLQRWRRILATNCSGKTEALSAKIYKLKFILQANG